jgi:hypothetical protein
MSEVLCPKCGSDQVTANKKGFSGKKAVVGAVLTGGVGLLAGTLGSNKVKITCLSCGHEFKPGQGAKSKEDFAKKNAGCLVTILALFAIGMLVKCGSSTNKETDGAKSEYQTVYDSLEKVYSGNTSNTNNASIGNSVEQDFITQKTEQFTSHINAGKSANEIKKEANQLSKSFLKKQNNELKDWEGVIISVDMFQEKELDIAITIQDRKIVGQKTISGRTMDCGITIEASQGTSKKYGFKGIARSGELYNKVKGLKEGDRVVFSAKVVDTWDNTEATGLNLSTTLHLKLTDIQKK